MEVGQEQLIELQRDVKMLLQSTSRMEGALESLAGNGQPGRVRLLEERISEIELHGTSRAQLNSQKFEEIEQWKNRVSRVYWMGLGGVVVIVEIVRLISSHVKF